MPVNPTGQPAWVRSSDLTTYGGDPEKQNYLQKGVVDSLTDVGAEQFSRMAADLAAVSRSAPFLTLTIQCDDTTPAAPTVLLAQGMTGVRDSSYPGASPPAGLPSVSRNGNGDVTITFASSYDDGYGVAGSFAAQHPRASLVGSTPGSAPCQLVSATQVRVRCFNAAGSALSNATVCVSIGSGS